MAKLVRRRVIKETYEMPVEDDTEAEMDEAENEDEEVEETPAVTVGLSGNKRKTLGPPPRRLPDP
jgi:hypothetical protein